MKAGIIDQANHIRCVVSCLRDDEAAIGVADQQRRSFKLREQVTRPSHIVSQRCVCMLRGDDKMALLLQRRDHVAPAGSVGLEPVYEDNVRCV